MFEYGSSILNPALKLVITFGYAYVVYLYFRCNAEFGDSTTSKALKALLLMGIFGLLAAFFRYLGHGTEFGFTKEFSLKWFQSACYLVQAYYFITAARYFGKASAKNTAKAGASEQSGDALHAGNSV